MVVENMAKDVEYIVKGIKKLDEVQVNKMELSKDSERHSVGEIEIQLKYLLSPKGQKNALLKGIKNPRKEYETTCLITKNQFEKYAHFIQISNEGIPFLKVRNNRYWSDEWKFFHDIQTFEKLIKFKEEQAKDNKDFKKGQTKFNIIVISVIIIIMAIGYSYVEHKLLGLSKLLGL